LNQHGETIINRPSIVALIDSPYNGSMDDRHDNQDVTEAWVQRWIRLGPILDALDDPSADPQPLCEIIPQFNDAFRSAVALHPPEPTSGLIEQQAIFRRARR